MKPPISLTPGWPRRGVHISFLVLAALFWALLITVANTCVDAGEQFAVEVAKAAGCYEFWLNRYQQLIAGIIAGCGRDCGLAGLAPGAHHGQRPGTRPPGDRRAPAPGTRQDRPLRREGAQAVAGR